MRAVLWLQFYTCAKGNNAAQSVKDIEFKHNHRRLVFAVILWSWPKSFVPKRNKSLESWTFPSVSFLLEVTNCTPSCRAQSTGHPCADSHSAEVNGRSLLLSFSHILNGQKVVDRRLFYSFKNKTKQKTENGFTWTKKVDGNISVMNSLAANQFKTGNNNNKKNNKKTIESLYTCVKSTLEVSNLVLWNWLGCWDAEQNKYVLIQVLKENRMKKAAWRRMDGIRASAAPAVSVASYVYACIYADMNMSLHPYRHGFFKENVCVCVCFLAALRSHPN